MYLVYFHPEFGSDYRKIGVDEQTEKINSIVEERRNELNSVRGGSIQYASMDMHL